MARRAAVIKLLRAKTGAALLLDVGGVAGFAEEDTETEVELAYTAMGRMGYDASCVSPGDFRFGEPFLRRMREGAPFSWVVSNLYDVRSGRPWAKESIVVERGGAKIAILGILPEEANADLERFVGPKTLVARSPLEVLATLAPKARQEADFVILLSQLDLAATKALCAKVPGIDLALSRPSEEIEDEEALTRPGAKVLDAWPKAGAVGQVRVKVQQAAVAFLGRKTFGLDKQVKEDPDTAALVAKVLGQGVHAKGFEIRKESGP